MTPGPGRLGPAVAAARTDANGTMWRLRSLIAMGHDGARIARALHVPPALVCRVVRGQARTVTCQFQATVRELWDAWWDKTPPRCTPAGQRAAARALRQAACHDWPAAAGLDEDLLDEPGYRPWCRHRPATGTGTAPDFPPARPRPSTPRRSHERQPTRPGRSGNGPLGLQDRSYRDPGSPPDGRTARREGMSAMNDLPPAQRASADQPAGADGDTRRTELLADLASARQARAAVRQALADWGMDHLADDAELLASELVANAAEHADGEPIGLALRRHAEPSEQPGLTCEVTDTSPAMPRRTEPGPDAERGRGLAIVDALAQSSGVRASHTGKTTWFTLALTDRTQRAARQIEHEPEAGV